jgi:hypothetical protein
MEKARAIPEAEPGPRREPIWPPGEQVPQWVLMVARIVEEVRQEIKVEMLAEARREAFKKEPACRCQQSPHQRPLEAKDPAAL